MNFFQKLFNKKKKKPTPTLNSRGYSSSGSYMHQSDTVTYSPIFDNNDYPSTQSHHTEFGGGSFGGGGASDSWGSYNDSSSSNDSSSYDSGSSDSGSSDGGGSCD